MLRIISGDLKRRVIKTVSSDVVRPTTDRVRQSLFDFLSNHLDFTDATILDLFAGSGSLGFECLSRGASQCTFVESHRDVIRFLNETRRTLKVEDRSVLYDGDVLTYLCHKTERFDAVFADPPYRYDHYERLISLIFERGVLAENGLFLLEHHRLAELPERPELWVKKEFGTTVFSIYRNFTSL